MMKWIITLVIALVLISGLERTLRRFGFGRMPGDFRLHLFGHDLPVPLGSTLLLSGLMALVAWFL